MFTFYELIKDEQLTIFDGLVKSSRGKARKSRGMRRTFAYAAMTRDAAQRSIWTFYEVITFDYRTTSTHHFLL